MVKLMIVFNAKDVQKRRRVLLRGRIVTIIDLSGRKARIAEDGKWHEHKLFYPLMEEHVTQEHIEAIRSFVSGKSIATLKAEETGVQLVLDDNTRIDISYAKDKEGLVFSVIDSDGNKVL